MSDEEYVEIQRAADAADQTVSEWARLALRRARQRQSSGDRDVKLAAIRAAVRHDFPTADIDQMLEEIESGYTG